MTQTLVFGQKVQLVCNTQEPPNLTRKKEEKKKKSEFNVISDLLASYSDSHSLTQPDIQLGSEIVRLCSRSSFTFVLHIG